MAKRSMYTKRLGGQVAKNAKGSIDGKFHIVSSQTGKWAVVSEGSVRPVRAFGTQKEAVTFAKKYAVERSAGEVVIHGKDGSIRDRISYKS
jgi:hypothetical protein